MGIGDWGLGIGDWGLAAGGWRLAAGGWRSESCVHSHADRTVRRAPCRIRQRRFRHECLTTTPTLDLIAPHASAHAAAAEPPFVGEARQRRGIGCDGVGPKVAQQTSEGRPAKQD
ncbi:hypothetical protein EIQ10_14020 [Xanthomonas campestris pv. campestris]